MYTQITAFSSRQSVKSRSPSVSSENTSAHIVPHHQPSSITCCNKEVDLGEPTSFLDHVYLGCTQRQCEIRKDIVDNYRAMFESRISEGGSENLHTPRIFVFLRGLLIWKVMRRNVRNGIVSWQTRRLNNSTK